MWDLGSSRFIILGFLNDWLDRWYCWSDQSYVKNNGYFASSFNGCPIANPTAVDPLPTHLVYVTERNGSTSIYIDSIYQASVDRTRKRSVLEAELTRAQHRLVSGSGGRISMKDRPSLVGDLLVYMSTHEETGVGRTSWAAVYSTQLSTSSTRRLTPQGVADFSPAVFPSEGDGIGKC
ncbi:hypothetical protein L2E82_25182 [Cichorium intybus]|uniref:Uncharacterized protein n=1 Tax=Cichorium intybus TaxID=13427 RepID=A0ACB9E2U9_CICIN|nr:hypothetical protein L2E82_25182 [Cichorium intybus]